MMVNLKGEEAVHKVSSTDPSGAVKETETELISNMTNQDIEAVHSGAQNLFN